MKNQISTKNELNQNLGGLMLINQNLNRQLDSYKYNPETIKIQARDIGYINKSEKILLIKGMEPVRTVKKPGNVILPSEETRDIEKILRIFFIILLLFLSFSSAFAYIKERVRN